MCLKASCFPDCWKILSAVPVFKITGERCTAKNYHPVSLFSVVSKVLEKLVNDRIVDRLEKCGLFFLISSVILGLLNQLQIFWHLYLIELLGLLAGLGLLEHFIYPRLLTGFFMLVIFTNLFNFYGISVQMFDNGFGWLWIGSLYKNIQLILQFFKAPFLVLHFPTILWWYCSLL